MKYTTRKVVFLGVLALFLYGFRAKEPDLSYGDVSNVIYVDNYDGDTITVSIPQFPAIIGYRIPVRIYGIDTPEIKGKCQSEREKAAISKKLVHDTLKNAKMIVLRNMKRDKYFRILAIVIADNTNISELLISKGLATRYYGETKISWCK